MDKELDKEPEDNDYLRYKRKKWARRLNDNCENRSSENFREWDVDDLFPWKGWAVRGYCCYDGRVDWEVCNN